MGSYMHVILVFSLAIAFGEAFILTDLTITAQKTIGCYSSNVVSLYRLHTCFDNAKVESCLMALVPIDDNDKKALDWHLDTIKNERLQCPGFVGTQICRNSESYKCKENFNHKQITADDSICNELQEVRDCLSSRFNDSCSDDVLTDELSEVDNVDRDCKSGNFNGGPCSDKSILGCTMKVYLDEDMNEENNFKCNDTLVADAKVCFDSLENQCKTDHEILEISNERKFLNVNCEIENE